MQVRDDGLSATARGEPLDPGRHLLKHEVKAITYHELKVSETSEGWLAEVIVDICLSFVLRHSVAGLHDIDPGRRTKDEGRRTKDETHEQGRIQRPAGAG